MAFLLLTALPLAASILSFFIKKRMSSLALIASAAALIELIIAIVLAAMVAGSGSASAFGVFYLDALGVIVLLIVGFVGFVATWYSGSYLKAEVDKGIIDSGRVRIYFALLHLFLLAMFFAVTSASPVFAWISIEATTLSTAFLVSFYHKPAAIEAAWKYLIINSVGLLLAFFGTLLFLYPALAAGHADIPTWHGLAMLGHLDPSIARIAFIFVVIGYGTKVGLAPMHTWLPDAHSKAPVPVSALLSGVLLNVAFLAVLRFKVLTDAAAGIGFSRGVLLFFGLASLIVAAFIIFVQKNYKRLLAYSSIEHMGIAALGFGFGGAGAFAALLHMIYHSLAKSLLFLSSGNIFLKYSSTKIKKVSGVAKTLPITAALFVIGFLAIAGVPPFGIFNTEFSILAAGVKGHLAIVVIMLALLVLIFAGFLRHVVAMMKGESKDVTPGENGWGTLAPLAVIAAALLVLSVYVPSGLQTLLKSASANF